MSATRSPNRSRSSRRAAQERFKRGTLAFAVADSQNRKIGWAATTYVAQQSCPTSCPFFDGGGCYAEQGPLGQYITKPLNLAAAARPGATPEDLARAEANAIDALEVEPGKPLRLHTVGDCKTDGAAAIVAAAAARYVARGGGKVWTYTHAWRDVRRESWGEVHVLASCETTAELAKARGRGYATAIVIDEYADRRVYVDEGEKLLPCPAQTKKGVTCASCELCMKTEHLRSHGLTIAFEVHGSNFTQRRARLALTDPDNPNRRRSSRELIPEFIELFLEKIGQQPTTSEIAEGIGITRSSVYQMRTRLAAEAAERAANPTGS
jgi:hypothetical protein